MLNPHWRRENVTKKSNLERDEMREKFAAVVAGISRALECPEEANSILRELKTAEKMDRKVLEKIKLDAGMQNDCPVFSLLRWTRQSTPS